MMDGPVGDPHRTPFQSLRSRLRTAVSPVDPAHEALLDLP
jgi:hypothetical protein